MVVLVAVDRGRDGIRETGLEPCFGGNSGMSFFDRERDLELVRKE